MADGKQEVTVEVKAPRSTDSRTYTWVKTLKVGEAAAEAAADFGYIGQNPSFRKDDEVLDRQKPLVAEGVEDGDVLWIVDAGGGVRG